MTPGISNRLTKTENIQPLPKRVSKKPKPKPDTFDPKPNNEKVAFAKMSSLKPGADVAFKAILSARFCAAIWSHISDCDETFNYWEPLHYLVYGYGLKTWEYDPKFALRSYTYLLFHGVPACFYNTLFHPNPMLIIYFVRCLLGLCCATMEMYFYKAICREFGVQIGRIWLIFQLFSAGMFTAGTAFLLSTFSMYCSCASLAFWWHQQYPLPIFFVAISTILGWTFAAALSIPLCYDVLIIQKKYRLFAFWAAISGSTVLTPMVAIDTNYFGKLTIAPLNIVLYNVFTPHGPNLYGTEPWTYYFVNGFLNYNIIWVLALAAPFLLLTCYLVVPARVSPTLYLPYYLSMGPFYLWLLIFMIQPHKEERFLYPIYPMIALSGAISVDAIQKLFYRLCAAIRPLPPGSHYLDHTMWIAGMIMILPSILGLSRVGSLYNNYHAPMDVMMELNTFHLEHTHSPNARYNVCVGKDWYRFPSSFFLPAYNFRLRFLKSEFKGILPAYYDESINRTKISHGYFNDMNQENEAMYFNYTKCHFLIDLDVGRETELEPNYAKNTKEWTIVKSIPFINAEKSQAFYRAFLIPYISDRYVEYGQFHLLKRKKLNVNQ